MGAKVPLNFTAGSGVMESMAGNRGDSLAAILRSMVDDMNALKDAYNDLAVKYNNHITNGKHRVATAVDAAAPLATSTAVTIGTTKATS